MPCAYWHVPEDALRDHRDEDDGQRREDAHEARDRALRRITSTMTSRTRMSTEVGVHAREVGDLPAEPLRVGVAAVRAAAVTSVPSDEHPDRQHVDDAREVARRVA